MSTEVRYQPVRGQAKVGEPYGPPGAPQKRGEVSQMRSAIGQSPAGLVPAAAAATDTIWGGALWPLRGYTRARRTRSQTANNGAGVTATGALRPDTIGAGAGGGTHKNGQRYTVAHTGESTHTAPRYGRFTKLPFQLSTSVKYHQS